MPELASLSRVQTLKAKHAALSKKIEMEQSRPSWSDREIKELKQQKLRLKEEIESLS